MKKIIFVLVGVLVGCVQMIPDYQAPSLTTPINGETFSEIVRLEWLPNNKADNTTADYNFLVEIASDENFVNIKDHFSTKLETHYEIPIYVLKSGKYFWRIVSTYIQNPSGQKTIKFSETRTFFYDGNDGAIFVDPFTATTKNLGTKAQPTKTISNAFNLAFRRHLTQINLANATYIETIPQYFGMSVKGCFDSSTWIRNVGTCATTISDLSALAFYQINN